MKLSRRDFMKLAGLALLTLFLEKRDFGSSQGRESGKTLLLYEGPREQNELAGDLIKSHWNVDIEVRPSSSYSSRDIERFETLIYSGEIDREPSEALLKDVERTDKNILWINSPYLSDDKKGYSVSRITNGYDRIRYKDAVFTLNPGKVIEVKDVAGQIKAWSIHHTDGKSIPAIIKNKNVISILYKPYSFNAVDKKILALGEEGEPEVLLRRDLTIYKDFIPFFDSLHEVFGSHENNLRTLIRLEDINAYTYTDPSSLKSAVRYLNSKNIPFSMAVIPRYVNPSGNIDMELGENKELVRILRSQQGMGNKIILHGYTHQHDGISGVDYEFWDEIRDKPVEGDSREFARERIGRGRSIMESNGLRTDGFTIPQYTASATDWGVFLKEFGVIYQPLAGLNLPFQYIFNGTLFIPENLGYVRDGKGREDVERIKEESQDIKKGFQDPLVGFFWHPYHEVSELQEIIEFLEGNGYVFISPDELR